MPFEDYLRSMKIDLDNSNLFKVTDKGCKIWLGPVTQLGYGQLYATAIKDRPFHAHRVAYCLSKNVSYFSDFLVLHSCNIPACYEENHLRQGNQSENIKQSVKDGNHFNANKTHCVRGHEYNKENTILTTQNDGKSKHRKCRQCKLEYERK